MIQPNFGYSSSSLRILKRYIAWSPIIATSDHEQICHAAVFSLPLWH